MSIPYLERPYRKNVAAVVLNETGHILACRRIDFPDTWQLPQGGIEEDETEVEALLRELDEEIGTANVTIIGRLESTIRYDWPEEVAHKSFRGQEQCYFLVRLDPAAQIDFTIKSPAEFSGYEWLTSSEFLGRLDPSRNGGFKNAAYAEALRLFDSQHPGIIKR